MTTETPESAPLPPEVGPYLIEKQLGAGGMGTVYLGKHRETGKMAAVKVLPASMAREPGFIARFNREIDALRQVDSPNIVKLFESGESHGFWYYAMEYVIGETLADRLIRERRLPWLTTIEIGVQLCKALKTAHNAGIIHRDLKPSNLLLGNDGAVKLSDFGVAQVFASSKLTVTGGVIGTAEYMAPEQAQGRRANKQSDIYSLGAVLYVMLTGRPPFSGRSALEIAQKHKYGQFDSPRRIVPEIPRWLDDVVCNCLQKKPEDRYPDAYVLMLRLQEIPKKVEFQESPGAHDMDDRAETMASASRGEELREVGTLMRDLVRAQVAPQAMQTPMERFFDNVWVLVALLVFLVVTAIWWVKTRATSPEQLFARGEYLMSQTSDGAWEAAKKECFLPLLEKDREVWEPRVEPYLRKISIFEIKRDFFGRRASRTERVPRTEAERFLKRALSYRQLGETARARKTLLSLKTLLVKDEKNRELAEAVDTLLQELSDQTVAGDLPQKMLKSSLERANELAKSGEKEEAAKLWQSVIELYEDDPDARDAVDESRKQLGSEPK